MVAALFLLPAVAALSQTGDLLQDVELLNIRHRTDHYALAGTVSDARMVEYGRALEYIHREYSSGFGHLLSTTPVHQQQKDGSPPGRQTTKQQAPDKKTARPSESDTAPNANLHSPNDERFRVVIFRTDKQYQEFGSRYFGGNAEHSIGLYVSSAKLLLIRDETLTTQTFKILFHEAFHQFLDRHVPNAPIWVSEGLATYYGSARVTSGGLVFDRPQSEYFQIVRNAASARQVLPLDELMAYTPAEFYRRAPVRGMSTSRRTLAYSQSYSLVAFMLSEPQAAEHLRTYLRDLAHTKSPEKATEVTKRSFPAALLRAMVFDWLSFVNRQ